MKVSEINEHNRSAWDKQVAESNRWTMPVDSRLIEQARSGDLCLKLSPKTPLPSDWLFDFRNKEVLLLAGGGGHQSILLAASGAKVTVADISAEQLKVDAAVAAREQLTLMNVCCDAGQLPFQDSSFDFIFNPVSLCFFPDLKKVWSECSRVLRPSGHIYSAFINPLMYAFDFEKANQGQFIVRYAIPYSDTTSLNKAEKERYLHSGHPLEFSHSLSSIMGGLINEGFVIDKVMEDQWDSADKLNDYFHAFVVMRAKKMAP